MTPPRGSSQAASATANAIVDNRARKVGTFLRTAIDPESRMSVVSAYFTIYAYHDLRRQLNSIDRMRFLYGEPRGVGAMDPAEGEAKAYGLTDDGGMELKHALAQKPLAKACAEWIKEKVDIRTVEKINFLHGKLYHIARAAGNTAAVLGSSNFTRRGLGLGANPNIELNLEVRSDDDRERLLAWFDDLWGDDELTRDAKNDVLKALERLGHDYSPEFVYYKTLFHVLERKLAQHGEHEGVIQGVHLHDTEVWKALYPFQKDGAVNAINRLMDHNGCIVADSVGLGKTWTALAVIKFFETRNERVLVLCPKKLEENWIRYTSWAGYAHNPFVKDRLGYTVLAHTDLSRYKGMAGNIDLAKFNWSAFDLIVIDESHNFRNEGRDKKDEDGNLIRRSRYNRLLEELLKDGSRTKVLMLSATPVNTSLRDLRNQIYLMTEKRQDAFRETLGIRHIQAVFRLAQEEFQKWEKQCAESGTRDKAVLLERLGADFLAVLDTVTIARSRDHVRRVYPEVEKQIGGFPERALPENLHPPTDSRGELSYDDLHDRINKFRLAVYMPSRYLKDKTELEEEKARLNFDQRDREHWLVGMIRVNLLKRLESSVHSFTLTMRRILDKMEELDERIEDCQAKSGDGQLGLLLGRRPGEEEDLESMPDGDDEDEDFVFGKGGRYPASKLDLDAWCQDLRQDKAVFEGIYHQASQVGLDRDAKLTELRRVLRRKVEEAPTDKDGLPNRKALVFTTFADTARYLYDNLMDWARSDLGVHIALITGGAGNRSTLGPTGFADILGQFAPKAQLVRDAGEEVDILIATDCLSEGQNLQDCDLVINYDIHWNPVRLMQRFGRIDRIGSRNRRVAMANFWPTKDLDRYLNLKNRVEARMALADATGTGQDDLLAPSKLADAEQTAQFELSFRNQQLERLRKECLDLDDLDDGVSLSDLTLDDFLADLLAYLQANRAALEAAPFGIYAVAPPEPGIGAADTAPAVAKSKRIRPGVIFCLKQKESSTERTPNRLHPYFLTYVRDDGNVRYSFQQARQTLALFQAIALGRKEALTELVDAFDQETRHGSEMGKYEKMLRASLRPIRAKFQKAELMALTKSRGAKVTKRPHVPGGADNFELATWLVIADPTTDG